MNSKVHQKSQLLENLYEEAQEKFPQIFKAPQLSKSILKASSNYIFEENHSPWKLKWFQEAYLSYFLFTQSSRAQYVLEKTSSFLNKKRFQNIIDYGCGPGTLQKVYEALELPAPEREWLNYDHSPEALKICKKWVSPTDFKTHFVESDKIPAPRTEHDLFVGSYVLCENIEDTKNLSAYNSLLLIEPGQKKESKKLIDFRNQLIEEEGFFALSPCPHQELCPFTFEKKHWCHFTAKKPDFLNELKLPFSHNKLQLSYLFLTKDPGLIELSRSHTARVVGDPLKEKGKTKIALCQSERPGYLSWLKKTKLKPDLSRGDLIQWGDNFEIKGDEYRITEEPCKISEVD